MNRNLDIDFQIGDLIEYRYMQGMFIVLKVNESTLDLYSIQYGIFNNHYRELFVKTDLSDKKKL